MNDNPNLSFSKFLSTVLWTSKLGFTTAPFWYTVRFINILISRFAKIGEAFFISLVLQELINLLAIHQTKISNDLLLYFILSIVVTLIKKLSDYFELYIRQRYNFIFTEKTLSQYIATLSKLDIQYHESHDFKTMSEKVQEALAWKSMSMVEDIQYTVGNLIEMIFLLSLLSQINIVFIILIIIPVVLNFIIESKFGVYIFNVWNWEGEDKKEAVQAFYAFNDASVLAESKIYDFGDYILDKFRVVSRRVSKRIVISINKKFSLLAFVALGERVIFAATQLYLITQTLAGAMTIQIYTFYIQSIINIADTFTSMEEDVSRIYEYSLYMADFRTFLNLPDKVEKPKNGIKLSHNAAPSIEFKNVSFKYPNSENYIVKNLSFEIFPGDKIALVGENGAGKTTIIKLLARFYDPTEGEIFVNGQNLRDLDITSYYKLWGVLFQQFAQYWFTLRENIGLGNVEDINSKGLIEAAAEKAGLDNVISKLPKKFENMLSTDFKDGKNLSGGEWQKVGLARGFFANPKLIVWDEPTSALDALAEQEIFDEIQKISNDTTMIIVSHRFATVRNADKILVLQNGQITEQGTHDELMAHEGLYKKMFTTQAEGYK